MYYIKNFLSFEYKICHVLKIVQCNTKANVDFLEQPETNVAAEIMPYENIIHLNKDALKDTIMAYLILRDIISFGLTCKTSIFKFEENERPYTITKICTMNIPLNLVPHVTILQYINKSCSFCF
jgi:hypothetical protein